MKKKNIIKIICLLLPFVLILGFIVYMRNFHMPAIPLKEAVKKSELADKKYIICEPTHIDGFDWYLIQDVEGRTLKAPCNIIGAYPFTELEVGHEFATAGNKFIFYVTEKKTANNSANEYLVTGWDILYPVKNSKSLLPKLWSPKKYIIDIYRIT